MNSCRPTLKNEMLSRRSTFANASSTVGTSSATMIRSLPAIDDTTGSDISPHQQEAPRSWHLGTHAPGTRHPCTVAPSTWYLARQLPRHYITVAGGAHAAHEHARSRIDQDRLHRSAALDVAEVHLMPFRRQRVLDRFREHRRRQELALDVVRIVRIAEAVADHGRLLQRFLHVQAELHDVEGELQLRLRLGVGSWGGERGPRLGGVQ